MKVEECFELNLLKKDAVNIPAAKRVLLSAKENLDQARKLVKFGFYNPAIVFAYASAFQSIKAYLFYIGIREKSQACAIAYMKEKTTAPKEVLSVIDSFRKTRHDLMYGFSPRNLGQEDTELIISSAERIFGWVKSQMEQGQQHDNDQPG